MVDVVANTCFVSRETAAWMLDCLEQKGFQVTKIPEQDFPPNEKGLVN
jgi:hypothetical protein